MSPPSKSAKDLFFIALDIPPSGRAALLDAECGEDATLRRQVEALLKVHDEPDSLLDRPRIDVGISGVATPENSPTIDQPITEKPGTQIGPYKLLQRIGEGGMGVVYMAEQTEPVERRVALKIIKPGMDTRQVIARFEAERQALAMMDHPNIAKVLDAGTTDSGRPYFVMELVKGVPITEYCDERHLTPRERLELFLPVCQAVQHAHQKGIIHRDIKPSNVMVAEYDDRAVPKIIDFGVAKAIEHRLTRKTMFTELGQVVGTPEYMSPEQAKLNQLDIDTRSDIYSLGVLLYELLVGETPFDRQRLRLAAFDELLRIIREEEPPRPSIRLSTTETLPSIAANRQIEPKKLSTLFRGELDWIVMKALEKDRARRYETASKFAEDVQHHLNDEPVVACPPSAMYRLQKFTRRNKAPLAVTALATLALITVAIGSAIAAGRFQNLAGRLQQALIAETEATDAARKAREDAEEARDQEQQLRREAERQARRAEVAADAERHAKEAEIEQRNLAMAASEQERQQRLRAEELRELAEKNEWSARHNLYLAHMNLAAKARDAGHIARVERLLEKHVPLPWERDRRGFEWYYLLGECHRDQWRVYRPSTFPLAFSPTSAHFARVNGSHLEIWDVTGKRVEMWDGFRTPVHALAFSPDGKRIVSGGFRGKQKPAECLIWDAETGAIAKRLSGIEHHAVWVGFSPDGKVVAAADGGSYRDDESPTTVRLWDAQSGDPLRDLPGDAKIYSLAFSPDSRRLIAAGTRGMRMWNVATGESLPTGEMTGTSVAWSPKGNLVATVSSGDARRSNPNARGVATLWDASTGEKIQDLYLARPTPYQGAFWVTFSPDGEQLAAAMGRDNSIRVWAIPEGEEILTLRGHTNWVWRVAFSPEGRWLVSSSQDGSCRLWDSNLASNQMLPGGIQPWKPGHARGRDHLAVSPDGALLAATRELDRVVIMEVASRRIQVQIDAGHPINTLEFSPDGRCLATGSDKRLQTWDVATGELLHERDAQVRALAFAPDGSRLFVASGNRVQVHQAIELTAEDHLPWESDYGPITMLAVAPDGKTLAAKGGDYQGAIHLWDLVHQKMRATFSGPVWLTNLAFAPDGRTLAACSGSWFNPRSEGTTKLWDVATGRERAELKGHDGLHTALAFTPDGTSLATASDTGQILLWDLETYEPRVNLDWFQVAIDCLVFSPDGSRLFGSSTHEAVKSWAAATQERVLQVETSVLRRQVYRYEESGNWEKATAIYAHLRQRGNSDYLTKESLANCYLGNDLREGGDLQGAERAFQQAAASWNDVAIIRDIAMVLAFEENPARRVPDQAVRFAERAVELDETPDNWAVLGIAYYRAGQWEHANAALETANTADRFDSTVFHAMAKWQLGDREEARELYARAAALFAQHDIQAWKGLMSEAAELMGPVDDGRQ